MATVRPFAALRPDPALAARVCAPPYDVVSTAEARALAENNPYSFLHVGRPEIDLEPDTDVYSPEVYRKGAENFRLLCEQGALRQDDRPEFYLYRQIMGEHVQVGLVAVVDCDEYERNIIRKHELTRPAKEDDRTRHIEALDAQTGPVFLTYPAAGSLDVMVAEQTTGEPEVDFIADDGVRHSAWTLGGEEEMALVMATFATMPALYIADGHHRSAAAARVARARDDAGRSGSFLAVLFPHDQMQILAYNRVVKDLAGMDAKEFVQQLEGVFDLVEGEAPAAKNEVGLFLEGRWRLMKFRSELTAVENPEEALDVALLQRHVLEPMLDIKDPRTSERIDFVGGIRGATELERCVGEGPGCAFSLHPTSIEDLMAIADAGGLMPPKSTWFEPKLRDGLFCHML